MPSFYVIQIWRINYSPYLLFMLFWNINCFLTGLLFVHIIVIIAFLQMGPICLIDPSRGIVFEWISYLSDAVLVGPGLMFEDVGSVDVSIKLWYWSHDGGVFCWLGGTIFYAEWRGLLPGLSLFRLLQVGMLRERHPYRCRWRGLRQAGDASSILDERELLMGLSSTSSGNSYCFLLLLSMSVFVLDVSVWIGHCLLFLLNIYQFQ